MFAFSPPTATTKKHPLSLLAIQESLGFARPPCSTAENTQIYQSMRPPSWWTWGFSIHRLHNDPGKLPRLCTGESIALSGRMDQQAHDRMRRGRQARIDRDAKLMVKSWDMEYRLVLKYNDPEGEGPVNVGYAYASQRLMRNIFSM